MTETCINTCAYSCFIRWENFSGLNTLIPPPLLTTTSFSSFSSFSPSSFSSSFSKTKFEGLNFAVSFPFTLSLLTGRLLVSPLTVAVMPLRALKRDFGFWWCGRRKNWESVFPAGDSLCNKLRRWREYNWPHTSFQEHLLASFPAPHAPLGTRPQYVYNCSCRAPASGTCSQQLHKKTATKTNSKLLANLQHCSTFFMRRYTHSGDCGMHGAETWLTSLQKQDWQCCMRQMLTQWHNDMMERSCQLMSPCHNSYVLLWFTTNCRAQLYIFYPTWWTRPAIWLHLCMR